MPPLSTAKLRNQYERTSNEEMFLSLNYNNVQSTITYKQSMQIILISQTQESKLPTLQIAKNIKRSAVDHVVS
jgi:hypothetical protein